MYPAIGAETARGGTHIDTSTCTCMHKPSQEKIQEAGKTDCLQGERHQATEYGRKTYRPSIPSVSTYYLFNFFIFISSKTSIQSLLEEASYIQHKLSSKHFHLNDSLTSVYFPMAHLVGTAAFRTGLQTNRLAHTSSQPHHCSKSAYETHICRLENK